jgi:SpoOM protein
MGFFDKLKGMVGIGNPKLEIKLGKDQVKRGETLSGTAVIKGGQRETPVAAFLINLIGKETSLDKEGKKVSNDSTVKEERVEMGGVIVKPGEEKTVSFAFQIPSAIDPTHANQKWSLDFSIDIPGWDTNETVDILILEEKGEDFNEYEGEEEDDDDESTGPKGHYKLGYKTSFRHSSVKGDFRIFRLKDGGFCNAWKDETVVRNADYSIRYQLSNWGRWGAVSPDGSKLFMLSEYQKGAAIIDPQTGNVLHEIELKNYASYAAWTHDGAFIVLDEDEHLLVLNPNLTEAARSGNLPSENAYIGGIIPALGNSSSVLVSNSNGRAIHEYQAITNTFTKTQTFDYHPGELSASPDKSKIAVYFSGELKIVDANSLKVISVFPYPGMEDVLYFEEGNDEEQNTHFVEIFHFSPDGNRIMVLEGAGSLIMIDAVKGKVLKEIDRKLVNFVEHFEFIDDNTIAALTNDGMFKVVDIKNDKVLFEDRDID